MKRIIVGVAAAAVVLASCDSDRRAISRDDLPDVPAEATVVVELDADGFDPAELEITTADLVEVRNVGDENHGVRTDDYAIDTGPLFADEATEIVFDKPGRYTVFDTSDDEETLSVVVTEAVTP